MEVVLADVFGVSLLMIKDCGNKHLRTVETNTHLTVTITVEIDTMGAKNDR